MKCTWFLAAVTSVLCVASPAWAQIRINSTTGATTLFLDEGFEDDTVGAQPNAPTVGGYNTTAGSTVINDVSPGPFTGTNYVMIRRADDGAENSARLDLLLGTVPLGTTIRATFAYQYKSTGTSSTSFRLMSGTTLRGGIIGEPDFGAMNFYTVNGVSAGQVNSSLPVTPGAWQTIKIEYTSGSSDLALTVNGTSETLLGAITGGTIDTIRFSTANTNTTYYLDGEIKVENITPASPTPFLDDGFEDDTVGTNPNAPTVGSWVKPSQTTAGAAVINDVTPGAFSGTNYLRMQRTTGQPNTAQIEAVFGTVAVGNTLRAAFAYQYVSGSSSTVFRLMSGATQRVAILGEPDFSAPNFYTVNGANVGQVNSSLPVTPGAWQTIGIQYTSGSSDLTLTVNGTSETLVGAVTGGTVDRIRFNTANSGTTYYLDAVRPLLVSIEKLPDNNQKLTFDGGPGGSDVVQATTNLTDWISLSTNLATGLGSFTYSDLTATNFTQRFYRGVSQ
jgi:hypothetical protein